VALELWVALERWFASWSGVGCDDLEFWQDGSYEIDQKRSYKLAKPAQEMIERGT
jgi:hypothetical protein